MSDDLILPLPGWLAEVPGEQPHRVAFATVSGAHLYGFPSVDSDVDLRGAHVLPVAEVAGLRHGPETLERSWTRDGVEMDLVTHDLAKFCRLLLGRNGYVLEQLLSPLVVTSSPVHEELVALKREAEHGRCPSVLGLEADVEHMTATLERARDDSALPERATAQEALHDLVVRARTTP